MRTLLFFLFFIFSTFLFSQKDSIRTRFSVSLDSITVTAAKQGFDVDDFIEMVKNDQSFYRAFRNIRTLSYSAENEIIMFSKKGKEKANYQSSTQQKSDGTCRTMVTFNQLIAGNFYKRKNRYRYYTAKMFDRLFFTHGEICESKRNENQTGLVENQKLKGMTKHINELKKLIFYPGQKAEIPFIGKKTAIFEEKMARHYNFYIQSKKYSSEVDCYVFIAQAKSESSYDHTVIKYMETYFDKSNFQVIGRNFFLKYQGAIFDFDVKMKIKLTKFGEKYVPEFIEYNGEWDVPTKRPEISNFSIRFSEYY